MALYHLFDNWNTTSSVVAPVVDVVARGPSNPEMPALQQTFHLVVTATAGNASGTAKLIASNDRVNWIAIGSDLTASSTYLVAQAATTLNLSWKFYGAYLSAISGTGAVATLIMSA